MHHALYGIIKIYTIHISLCDCGLICIIKFMHKNVTLWYITCCMVFIDLIPQALHALVLLFNKCHASLDYTNDNYYMKNIIICYRTLYMYQCISDTSIINQRGDIINLFTNYIQEEMERSNE
jgi:hypothetical protein